MAKKKFKWTDTEDIAFLLIDRYPSTDPMRLSLSEISKRAEALPQFGGGSTKPKEEALAAIQKVWFEERADMEDELGPLPAAGERDDLDEDEFRDDRMIDDEASLTGVGDDDDDDEDEEDEFGEGFHEEEIADER